jgi:hypothetical protein
MIMKKLFQQLCVSCFVTLAWVGASCAQETLLDDVETLVEGEWIQVRINFNMPVNYLRHSPTEHGQLVQIFFHLASLDLQNVSLTEERRHVAGTATTPGFTVTYERPVSTDLQRTAMRISVRFDRVVNFSVRPGENNRSLVLLIPIVPKESGFKHAPKAVSHS